MDVAKSTSIISPKKCNVGLEIQIQDLLLNYTEVKCKRNKCYKSEKKVESYTDL